MRTRAVAILAVGMWLGWPAAASACDFYLAYTFLGAQNASFAIGGRLNIQPGSDGGDTFTIANADVAIPLGERGVVLPAVGICSGGDETELTAGGGVGVNLFNSSDGLWSVNVQSHLAWASFEGGSEITAPVIAAASYAVNESASIFAGAGLQIGRVSFDSDFSGLDGSETDSDPVGFAGVSFGSESVGFSAGVQIKKGDEDTDYALVGGLRIPIG